MYNGAQNAVLIIKAPILGAQIFVEVIGIGGGRNRGFGTSVTRIYPNSLLRNASILRSQATPLLYNVSLIVLPMPSYCGYKHLCQESSWLGAHGLGGSISRGGDLVQGPGSWVFREGHPRP